MRFLQKFFEIVDIAISGIDMIVVGNIISVVFERRGVEGQQPDGRYAQIFEIIEFFKQTLEITNSITIAITKGFNVQFVNDRVFVPVQLIV